MTDGVERLRHEAAEFQSRARSKVGIHLSSVHDRTVNVSQLDAFRFQILHIRRSPQFACHHPSPSSNNCRRKPPVRHLQCSHHHHPHRCCCTERLEAHKLLLFRVPSIYNRTAKVFPPFRCFFLKLTSVHFFRHSRPGTAESTSIPSTSSPAHKIVLAVVLSLVLSCILFTVSLMNHPPR